MRILAISDSHGNNRPIYKAVDMLRPDAVLFAGDGAAAAEEAAGQLGLPFYIVKGNCDYGAFEPQMFVKLGSKSFFLAHGHQYHVKYGYDAITATAKNAGVDVAVFGHTHIAYSAYDDGLYLLNPGSCAQPRNGKPSCGYIDISRGSVITNIVYL